MEVFLLLLHHLLRALNRVGMKPLPRVGADAMFLREHPVHIGPGKRYGTVLGIALGASAILWVASCAGLLSLDVNPQGRGPLGTGLLAALCILSFGGPILIGCVSKRFIAARTGHAVLHGDGVLFSCGDETVFCPWELFDTPGAAVSAGPDKVVVPIAPEALQFVVVEKAGMPDHDKEIKTRQLVSKGFDEIVLRDSYEVELLDFGALLLYLGRRLSQGVPRKQFTEPDSGTNGRPGSRFAWEQGKGWICARLSRLHFPEYCCGCGIPTNNFLDVRAYPSFLGSLLARREHAYFRLAVPTCTPCQKEGRRRRWKWGVLGVGLALFLLFGMGFLAVSMAAAGAPTGLLIACSIAAAIVPLVVATYGIFSSRRRSMPVEAAWYSPRDGTVCLRFRRAQYAEELLAACNT